MTRHNNPDNPDTSIKVKRTTRNKLNKLRKYPTDYLDLVIVRLINNYENGDKNVHK